MLEPAAAHPLASRPPSVVARAAVAGVLLAVLAGAFSVARVLTEDDSPQVGAIYDWARDYESLEELLAIPSAIAVIGTVTSVDETFPESTVTLDEVLVGSEVAPGDAVTVLQLGAQSGRMAHEPRDARHLDLGERVLLVLVYDETRSRYFIAGGPHGHFTIDGTRIAHANFGSREYGISAEHPDGHPLARLAEQSSLEEFKRRVIHAAPE